VTLTRPWCSGQHGAAIDHDHLARAVGFPHQIHMGVRGILDLADATDRAFELDAVADFAVRSVADN
jgi:hypothetical protein